MSDLITDLLIRQSQLCLAERMVIYYWYCCVNFCFSRWRLCTKGGTGATPPSCATSSPRSRPSSSSSPPSPSPPSPWTGPSSFALSMWKIGQQGEMWKDEWDWIVNHLHTKYLMNLLTNIELSQKHTHISRLSIRFCRVKRFDDMMHAIFVYLFSNHTVFLLTFSY